MSPSKRDNRAVLIFIVALLLIAPLAIILFNNDVDLRGTAIIQEATPEVDDSAVASGAPVNEDTDEDAGGEAETPAEPTALPPTAVPATSVPVAVTEEAAPVISPEATEEPTLAPETTAEPDPEITPEVDPETTPEFTPVIDPEATPEVTPVIDPEATPEVEATEEPDTGVRLEAVCTPSGGQFILTNGNQADETGTYTITDANGETLATGDFALTTEQAASFDVGFGAYTFTSDAGSVNVDCAQGVEIVVSYECTVADGVIFSLSNVGGPQSEAISYTLDEVEGSFIIEGENVLTLEAGYGLPVLAIGEAVYSPEQSCDEPGEIRGSVWDDADGNGLFGSSENGLADVRVILVNDEGITIDTVTEADGSYIFVHLAAGQYTVSVDWESVPQDYVWTYDLDGSEAASVSITVGIGESIVSDFGFREQIPVTVNGVIWDDANGDAFLSDGENGLADVVVVLSQNGAVVQTVRSGENGVYQFADVLAGDYVVSVDLNTLRAGFAATYDLDGGLDNQTAIQAENGVDINGVDFGFKAEANGVIDGLVWADANQDGLYSDGESAFADVAVVLTDANGAEIHTSTNATGAFRFENLAIGTYTVYVDGANVPAGYAAVNGDSVTVELAEATAAESVSFAFAAEATASISGFIWLELNNYGVYDSHESGFKGLTVALLDANGATVDSVTLGADGVYTFSELLPGQYTVSIVTSNIPSKLIVTVNPAGDGEFATSLTLTSGEAVQGVDFGILGTF